jgi:TRAP-type transport system small permease protein
MGALTRTIERLSAFLAHVSALGVVLMMSLVVVDVALRTFANTSTLLAEEVCGYLLVLVAYFAYAEALKRDGHIRVDMVFKVLSERVRARLDLIFCIVSAIAIFVVAWASVIMVYRAYARGVIVPGILLTPVYLPQIAVVVGLVALLLQLLVEIRKLARKG